MTSFYLLLIALLMDCLLGEPRRWHPLAGFGNIVHRLEQLSLHPSRHLQLSPIALRARGILAASAAIVLPVLVFIALSALLEKLALEKLALDRSGFWQWALQALILYFCIGWRSLEQHAIAVWRSLAANQLDAARTQVGMIVSRDTAQMNETQVAQAATESVLENGSDAVFAPIFWFLVGGAPAVLFYRLANTVDAMWGYRTPRYKHFGWFAARLDDLLNFIPARLCAFSYSLAGNTRRAWSCWRTQAKTCSSPNGGPVMTAGAGALQVQLGGPTVYHGTLTQKPYFGEGEPAADKDIVRACQLINRSLLLWLAVIGSLSALYAHGW